MNRSPFFKPLSHFSLPRVLAAGLVLATVLFALLGGARASVSSGQFLPLVLKGIGAGQESPRLLISEVMVNPPGADPGGEWIELYLVGGLPVDLQNFRLGDAASPTDEEGLWSFPESQWIAPGEVLIIANSGQRFYEIYGRYPDFEANPTLEEVPNLQQDPSWGSGPVELTNYGDELLLLDAGGRQWDSVCWGSSTYAFEPCLTVPLEGHSLERFPAWLDTDQASDWRTQFDPQPGEVIPRPTSTPLTPVPTPPTPAPVGKLVINEIHVDPHVSMGDANHDAQVNSKEDIFVEILNLSENSLDLSGWTLGRAWGPAMHIFPPGTLLPSGCAVVVFGGGAPQGDFGGALVQLASSELLYFSPAGDTVVLHSPGEESTSYTYGDEASADQAITRSPDGAGSTAMVQHSTASGSGGALFSPGTRLDGTRFAGCPAP